MTARLIRGPWCDSPMVAERILVEACRQAWPKLAPLSIDELRERLHRAGMTDGAIRDLLRILRKHATASRRVS